MDHIAQSLGGFAVHPGQTVTAWELSPVDARYYPGAPAPAEDRVGYRFINGFVDVGDLPCRIALWREVAEREVALVTDWPVESVNLPGSNRKLDFSDFWHRPTRLSRWCRTRLMPPEAGDYRFRVATRGGVHIWVDGALAATFEPFSRNAEQAAEIVLSLKADGSDVVMLSEDLAERDTRWTVELTLLSDTVLEAQVAGAGADGMGLLMALAASVRPEREVLTGGRLVLVFDRPAPKDVRVRATVRPSVHRRGKAPLLEAEATLRAGDDRVDLAALDGLADAYHPLDLVFEVDGSRIDRHIAFALLRETAPPAQPGDLGERKRTVLAHAAEDGELRIGRALAMLALGRPLDAAFETIIADTLQAIEERQDCSDFIMVPLLWIYGAYRDALPEAMAERIHWAILGYRYWVDEPGNDVMWFWSENHVLCFHVSQLLAGRLLPDEVFSASGRTGAEQARLAEERLGQWFDSTEDHGLAEWNSAAYYPVDFIGLFALQRWADGAIKRRTETLLDRLFTMLALHTLGGVAAGSMGRAYDKELRAGPLTELAPFATVAFGEGWLNDGVAALPMFCAGDYEPPLGLERYARPSQGLAVTAHYEQGYGHAANLALYKTAWVQLSATVDGVPGRHGHQQHLVDIRFAGHPFARAWVNHPGDDDPWGGQRPSYWAGNGVMPRVGQYQNAVLMLYDLGEEPAIPFTHAFAPRDGFDETVLRDNWLILRSGRGFAALTAAAPLSAVTEGPGAGLEYRVHGARIGWIGIVGDLADGAGLDTVGAMLDGVAVGFDAERMRLRLDRPGLPTLCLDYAEGLAIDGRHYRFPNPDLEPLIGESTVSALPTIGSGAAGKS
ncbi:hypothetical protein [Consotaella aegiceratis]|uniref:hypothetical protein n=1 Tax=Consotaella aegiceratis TaxID=3097961 RepID=UPI002F40423B